MDALFESPATEVARLRDCLNDLAGIVALPALSTGGEPEQIVSTLADALLGMLRLAFVCVRVNDPEGGPSIETMRIGEPAAGEAGAVASLASARLGLHGELGIVVAGSWKLDFPADTERLLLDVAANQAAIGLQQARLRSEQKGIMNTIPGLVAMLTPAGEVDVVNHELVEYCGQPLEAMRQWGTNGTVHADDVPRVGPLFTQAIAGGEPYDFEARVRRFDGVYRWCQIRGLPQHDMSEHIARWFVLLTDIDDRKRADVELRRAYDSFADAQRLSKTGSFITDLVADDHHWSDEAYRIFEFDPGTTITVQKIRDIIHPDDLPSFDSVIARGMTGANVNFGFRIVTARNTVKHVRGVAHVVERVEGRPMFVGALQDVTESMVAEEALSRARSELAHVSRVSTLSALTASIAHEVNQPLSGIITNASTCLRMLAADPPDIDGARLTAKRTIRDGHRASDVIARLRDLFIRKEFTLGPLDLNEAAREVIALSSNDLQRNRVILQSELADGLPFVTGDRIQLQQVILNLLRNASDAMVDVRDRPRQLLIKTEREDGQRVRLAVRDAGVGFSPRSMDSLFDAFYTTKSGGMGIGLFVSRSIVEKHHGRLWAQPNDGPGVTFFFSIPCASEIVTDAAPAVSHR